MKKIISLVCSILLVISMLSFVSCKNNQAEEKGAESFVSLDINPEIELTVDSDNVVLSVYGANEDAQVLLYGESGIVGVPLDKAIEKITDLAVELGFLSEDNKVVSTSVSSANQDKIAELENLISTKVTATASNLGLTVSVGDEGAFSLLRKLEKFKAENPNNQLIQSLSVEKFKLALSASETGEVSLDVAVTLGDKELIEMVSNVYTQTKTYVNDAYNKVKAEAFLVYDRLVNSVLDNVYAGYYLENFLKHPTTFWYGQAYQVYKTVSRGFGDLANLMFYVEKVSSYPIDESLVAEVLTALQLDASQIDKLKNSDGEITLDSIESYVDVMIKNAGESVDLTQLKVQISTVLDKIDTDVLADVKNELAKYQPQIETVVELVGTVVNSIKTATNTIPDSFKKELDAFITDVQTIVESVSQDLLNGDFSSQKLDGYAKTMGKKADEMLAKIKADLSEDELKTIETRMADLEKTLSDAKKSMEDAITLAEQEISNRLAELKNGRKQSA
ncbi:MAG: hypothetical protein IJC87_01580 [Clostridia bacterium]|nr:hypothetical protein [Clostridia bacterium]